MKSNNKNYNIHKNAFTGLFYCLKVKMGFFSNLKAKTGFKSKNKVSNSSNSRVFLLKCVKMPARAKVTVVTAVTAHVVTHPKTKKPLLTAPILLLLLFLGGVYTYCRYCRYCRYFRFLGVKWASFQI